MAMGLHLPPTYLLSTHLAPDELHALEEQIPSLTWDIHEADLVLGKISRRERALFELRRLSLRTEELPSGAQDGDDVEGDGDEPSPKRRKVSTHGSTVAREAPRSGSVSTATEVTEVIKVVKLSWFTESVASGALLPMEDYLLYAGRKLPQAAETDKQRHPKRELETTPTVTRITPSRGRKEDRTQPPALLHETTSEHNIPLPLIPDFLQTSYSCQRPTPVNPPNADFIEELKDVRTLRILQGDQIGVRAYSSSIASLAAYPYALQTPGGMLLFRSSVHCE